VQVDGPNIMLKKINKIKENFVFIVIIISLISIYGFINHKIKRPKIKINYQNHSINLKKKFFRVFNFGQRKMISKLIWIKTLLNFDDNNHKSLDSSSWIFLRLNTITDLDPYFYDPYLYGGQYLSIIKSEPLGASLIYDKGLKLFPKDFWLNLNAGFNSYFELKKKKDSIKYYQKALLNPLMEKYNSSLPNFFLKIIHSNDKLAAYNILKISLNNTKDPKIRKKIKTILYSIKKDILKN